MNADLILIILVGIFAAYIISIIAVALSTDKIIQTEFCEQNGFQEYEHKSLDPRFCVNKSFEQNQIVFERKEIYCETNELSIFTYGQYVKACYFVKEAK